MDRLEVTMLSVLVAAREMVTDFTSNLQRTSRTRGLPPPPATSTPALVFVARVCMALPPFGAEHATATPLFAGIKSLGMCRRRS